MLAIPSFDRASIVLWLRCLAGRYAVLFAERHGLYLYTDPAGTMGIYHTASAAASTPSLLVAAQTEPPELPWLSECQNHFFPGKTCCHPEVHPLMANHELHLNTGTSIRFWLPLAPSEESLANVEKICTLLQQIVKGISAAGPLLASLSGGRDSRVILAALRAFAQDVRFFTIEASRVGGERDLKFSRELAARFQLNHQIFRSGPTLDWLSSAYDEIGAGMCSARHRRELDGVQQVDAAGCTHLGGFGGEVLRAELWPSARPTRADTRILARQAFPRPSNMVTASIDEWRRSVPPGTSPATVFDLFEFEQRAGRTAGINEACSGIFYETALPFASRELFELLQGIPCAMRYGRSVNAALIQMMWPELLEVPFTDSGRQVWKCLPKSLRMVARGLLRVR
ncbi:MAG: asparagine synthase-related protein [Opitutus sp.]